MTMIIKNNKIFIWSWSFKWRKKDIANVLRMEIIEVKFEFWGEKWMLLQKSETAQIL